MRAALGWMTAKLEGLMAWYSDAPTVFLMTFAEGAFAGWLLHYLIRETLRQRRRARQAARAARDYEMVFEQYALSCKVDELRRQNAALRRMITAAKAERSDAACGVIPFFTNAA